MNITFLRITGIADGQEFGVVRDRRNPNKVVFTGSLRVDKETQKQVLRRAAVALLNLSKEAETEAVPRRKRRQPAKGQRTLF